MDIELPKYEKCDCGDDCDFLDDNPLEPCYGSVQAVDEWWTEDDYGWYHACKGHRRCNDGIKYISYKNGN